MDYSLGFQHWQIDIDNKFLGIFENRFIFDKFWIWRSQPHKPWNRSAYTLELHTYIFIITLLYYYYANLGFWILFDAELMRIVANFDQDPKKKESQYLEEPWVNLCSKADALLLLRKFYLGSLRQKEPTVQTDRKLV